MVFLVVVPSCTRPRDPRLTDAIRRAVDWAGGLDVHPLRLRSERGMKGVKHFVEYLDLLLLAATWPDDATLSAAARARALDVLRVADEDAYHNLAAADPQRFKEDNMSYLRACWLARELGKDISRYRGEIEKVLPRLHQSLPGRGIDQRLGFALLLAELGLPPPETEADVYPLTCIARRLPLSYYLESGDRPYDITHEIFALTSRGSRPFTFPSAADERYARETVRSLLAIFMKQGNVDLAAEFLVNLAQLGEADTPLGREAREFIFRGQNPDGSFGAYDQAAAVVIKGNPRYDVRVGAYLHTTMVAIWALVSTAPNQSRQIK